MVESFIASYSGGIGWWRKKIMSNKNF